MRDKKEGLGQRPQGASGKESLTKEKEEEMVIGEDGDDEEFNKDEEEEEKVQMERERWIALAGNREPILDERRRNPRVKKASPRKTQAPLSAAPVEYLKRKGLKPKHPVILIPGLFASELEVLEAPRCGAEWEGEVLWGDSLAVEPITRLAIFHSCVMHTLSLDPNTGLDRIDPETGKRIAVRPSGGYNGSDYIMGFSVWGTMKDNLEKF